jgi:catechol 2,3-dioxygenase-like lactoylglutathione lyase family enzyme
MLQTFPLYAYIPAKDVARARRFYERKLGFRPKLEVPRLRQILVVPGKAGFILRPSKASISALRNHLSGIALLETMPRQCEPPV